MDAIDLYEKLAAQSRRMLTAARESDWDGLVAAENVCALLIERLRGAAANDALAPPEHARKHEIIRSVLRDDAEIRAHVAPWLAELESRISASRAAPDHGGRAGRVAARYGN